MSTEVPHKVRTSFDMAMCPCGWYTTADDAEYLAIWAKAHEEAYASWFVEFNEVKR